MKFILKFWKSADGGMERVYVNGVENQSIGYFERRSWERERGTSSYYDRHRRCKGDDFVTHYKHQQVFAGVLTAAEVLTALLDTPLPGCGALFHDFEPDHNGCISLPEGLQPDWYALCQRARYSDYPPFHQNTPHSERKANALARNTAIFEAQKIPVSC